MSALRKFVFVLFTLSIGYAQAQTPAALPTYQVDGSAGWMQTKNYYLLTLLEQDAAASKLIAADAVLANIIKQKKEAFKTSLECKDVSCFVTAGKFSEADIQTVSDRLKALYQPANALGRLVQTKLIPSGAYYLYQKLSPAEVLIKAWEQDALGVNYAIDVYAGGKKPNYPAIDSISFDVKAKRYPPFLIDVSRVLVKDIEQAKLFFQPSLKASLLYLDLNYRHDPANYEPMQLGVNKAAFNAVKTTKWANYKYSALLVLGAGGGDMNTPISAPGMLRCRLAAQRYLQHAAPFIIVSGGRVHPFKTTICEAEQMKRFLVETLHIPAAAIIMEPHARHTTTNVRNAVRLMLRYGMPTNKPATAISETFHIDGVMKMADRCLRELKYVPYKLGNRVSETEVEFYPLVDAFQINPLEPLDP
jgi:uncharacterized SAM-binding protein YcdF (DUF218 family)